jgi:ribosome biogenesis GTPase A
MEPLWTTIEQIVRESDIVLEILDARAVDLSRNEQLEKIIAKIGRPRIYVLNKCDLVNRKDLEKAMDKIMHERDIPSEYVVFFSNRQKRTIRNLLAKIRQVFAKHGKRPNYDENRPIIEKPYREAKGDIVIGVVGYPNVGKSSVINAISFKHKAKVSSKAGTTHGVHWITANDEIKLIDSPGVIPLGTYVEESRLGLIAAKNPEKLKDPEAVAVKIIELFVTQNKLDKIEKFYNFKISEEVKNENNACLILEALAIAKNHLKKGGVPDDTRTSYNLIKDWQTGRLALK